MKIIDELIASLPDDVPVRSVLVGRIGQLDFHTHSKVLHGRLALV